MSNITDGNQIWPKIQQQSIVYSNSHIKFVIYTEWPFYQIDFDWRLMS